MKKLIENLLLLLLILGGFIILVQAVYISYGTIMRYVFNSPDGTVTEATALMLMPVAFLGLGYALKKDAYPKVDIFVKLLPVKTHKHIEKLNLIIMIIVGAFFSAASILATVKSIESGASSEILLWPKYIFWAPVSFSLTFFTLYAITILINRK